MATFIEVSIEQRGETQTAYVNVETIRYVRPQSQETAFIAFDDDRNLIVQEPADALFGRIRAALAYAPNR